MSWASRLDHSSCYARSKGSWCVPRFIATKLLLSFLRGRKDGKTKEIPVSAVISISSRAARVPLLILHSAFSMQWDGIFPAGTRVWVTSQKGTR